jgi:hypothetical protein
MPLALSLHSGRHSTAMFNAFKKNEVGMSAVGFSAHAGVTAIVGVDL